MKECESSPFACLSSKKFPCPGCQPATDGYISLSLILLMLKMRVRMGRIYTLETDLPTPTSEGQNFICCRLVDAGCTSSNSLHQNQVNQMLIWNFHETYSKCDDKNKMCSVSYPTVLPPAISYFDIIAFTLTDTSLPLEGAVRTISVMLSKLKRD